MPFETHELEAIKQAVADSLISTLPDYPHALTPGEVVMSTLAAIDGAASDPIDPRPFIPGRKVRVKGTGIQGVVVRTVEEAGEVHTVVVRLALDEGDVTPETPFGPNELEVLA